VTPATFDRLESVVRFSGRYLSVTELRHSRIIHGLALKLADDKHRIPRDFADEPNYAFVEGNYVNVIVICSPAAST
jgi:hypothetical protein